MSTTLQDRPTTATAPPYQTQETGLSDVERIHRAIASWPTATNILIDIGRTFGDVKGTSPKRYKEMLEAADIDIKQANKLIQMAEVADEIPSQAAERLSIHMLIQLRAKNLEPALDAITYEDTQQSVAQKMKDLRIPPVPKEKKPVRRIGRRKAGGGDLCIEIPSGEQANQIEQDFEGHGTHPTQWLMESIQARLSLASSFGINPETETSFLDLTNVDEVQQKDLGNELTDETQEPCEQDIAQAELDNHVETQAQSIAPEDLSDRPSPNLSGDRNESTENQAVIPLPYSIEHEAIAKRCPQSAIAYPNVNDTLHWNDKPSATVSKVTKAGIINLKYSGEKKVKKHTLPDLYGCFCPRPLNDDEQKPLEDTAEQVLPETPDQADVVEEVSPTTYQESDASLTPSQITETEQIKLLEVGNTGDGWEGEIVELLDEGTTVHRVSRLDKTAWTDIYAIHLHPISNEEGTTLQAKLAEDIFTEYGLSVGDSVQYKVDEITFPSNIVRLTRLGAYIDDGESGYIWKPYSEFEKTQEVKSPQVILEAATSWSDIEREVKGDRQSLTELLEKCSPEESKKVQEFLIQYIEQNEEALKTHAVDWVPFNLLESTFELLAFEVKDISQGLMAQPIRGCKYQSVREFGSQEDEIWKFVTPENQTIVATSRSDIKVLTF
ncbi:hypothetical protein G7B40_031070 [Aetokthonos hydrillicola Thurmond2011]|jgi:hypothetical protein|uniref:Uncharacterized protein n=2 Tax=Aetokthonos TaxID=1550243 RepID=A0AAP5MCA6_9CYAN|nr:hypothetical protein [Aetokthonos hydrillicola]MBO3462119.1 hypothetical protein [Aetokthonos hydrillicola CCALA 1050]MBW4589713.1 hypothetical protein [Aetokthonos hydrillicola CCALA 1050]MDR9898967.1 hypothetical protein [Aetokthonos hydrillicola Thurmond2011]